MPKNVRTWERSFDFTTRRLILFFGGHLQTRNNVMSTLRLYHGRNRDEMVKRLREYQSADSEECISSLEVRETVVDDTLMDAFVDLLQTRHVKTVQLDNCGAYMSAHATRMVHALGSVENVTLIEPTFRSYHFLDSLLLSATNLKHLRIQDRFDRRQIKSLAKGLKGNKSVTKLDLSRSRFDSFPLLAEGLKANTYIVDLMLRSIGLNDDNVGVIFEALKEHSSLSVLDLSFNHCQNMDALASLLVNPGCRLCELSLGYQNIWQSSQIEFATLARALRKNKCLKTLSLARNKLRDQDILLLTTALACNNSLQRLDLRENLITSEGISGLATLLKKGSSIRRINVLNNPFDEVGSLALLDAVQSNHHLFKIDVSTGVFLHHQIRFNAALNRGGRGLLIQHPPLALWPLVLHRINSFDSANGGGSIHDDENGSFRIDVLQHMLRGPALFEVDSNCSSSLETHQLR